MNNRNIFLLSGRLAALVAGCLAMARCLAVDSYIPAGPETVLERLPLKPADEKTRQLRELRRAQQADPAKLAPAIALAGALMQRAAREADPRYLGQAEACLSPWWRSASPPPEVLLLQGGIEQSRHDFEPAVATLRRAVKADPREPQGWLTLASIYTVRGQYAEARPCCLRLASLADDLSVAGATAGVSSMTGGARGALAALESVLSRYQNSTDPALAGRRLWCETLAGEIAERLDEPVVAERHFRNALKLEPADPYALGACADFLLDARRDREASILLEPHRRCDGLLQRYAEARLRLEGPLASSVKDAVETLSSRFEALALRGERVHLREEARFRLRLQNDPVTAQKLAMENWNVQREAADVRLLLETSRASENTEGARMALEWVRTNRLEDAVFQRLAGVVEASR